jgi:hypothetical protein
VGYPGILFPLLPFGTVSQPKNVILTNLGATQLTITSIGVIGGAFSQTNNCGSSVPAGSSCTISITFDPTTETAIPAWQFFYGSLVVKDNDPGSLYTVPLFGRGKAVTLYPGGLNFGFQKVGTSSQPLQVTVYNHGSTTLTFASITASGDFSETDDCTNGVPANSKCRILVTFTPTGTGTRSGMLTLNDNDSSSPQTAKLIGVGD